VEIKKAVLLGGLLAFVFTGCKKYPDGGYVKDTEKNIKKTWRLEKYIRNGVDETSLLLIRDYRETYGDGGRYDRSWIDYDGKFKSESGTWEFDKSELALHISGGISSIKFSANGNAAGSSHYNILKLTDSELWYDYSSGGDRHEFHFVKM